MNELACHFPERATLTAEQLLDRLPPPTAPRPRPFSEEAVAFCAAASEVFARAGGADGAWAAAGFFFRPASIARLQRDLEPRAGVLRAARGLVFHVAPGNVETQFVYSWLLSVLAGNANVVRLSSKLADSAFAMCDRLAEIARAPEFRWVQGSSRVVAFGHERATLDLLSRRCELRVLWGGDAAIEAVRASPLRPDAREVAFPDRLSLCLLGAGRFLAMAAADQRELARAFALDVWTFDQMACSSPRALVWCGSPAEAREASESFAVLLAAELEAREIRVPLAAATEKMRIAFGAIAAGRARSARRCSNELVVVDADDLAWLQGSAWAPGLIAQIHAATLADLPALLHPGQQTLTYGALDASEIATVGAAAASRGLSRVVPVGRALSFSATWDGVDLLHEMTRLVVVEAPGRSASR